MGRTAELSVWTPQSWRTRDALPQPEYPGAAALEAVPAELRTLPPLVTSWEIVHNALCIPDSWEQVRAKRQLSGGPHYLTFIASLLR